MQFSINDPSDSWEITTRWLDHNNIEQHTVLTAAIIKDKPRTLELDVDGVSLLTIESDGRGAALKNYRQRKDGRVDGTSLGIVETPEGEAALREQLMVQLYGPAALRSSHPWGLVPTAGMVALLLQQHREQQAEIANARAGVMRELSFIRHDKLVDPQVFVGVSLDAAIKEISERSVATRAIAADLVGIRERVITALKGVAANSALTMQQCSLGDLVDTLITLCKNAQGTLDNVHRALQLPRNVEGQEQCLTKLAASRDRFGKKEADRLD